MTPCTIHIATPADIDRAAKRFVELMDDATVFAFEGEMGAGKTTFISALSRALGVGNDQADSPSFALINEYRSDTTAELIYHFDLYRLKNLEEAMDLGIEDYLDSGALCLIEWPGIVEDILPEDTVHVTVKVNDDQSRDIVIA